MRDNLVIALLLAAGCDVATSEVRASYEVSILDGQLYIVTYFGEPGGSFPDLGDAAVIATFREQEIRLSWRVRGMYSALVDLDGPLVTDEPITIALWRDGEADAPSSTITVPPVPDVAPLPLFVPRSKPLTLSWSTTTDDEMWWKLDARCVHGNGPIPPGVATFTIAPTALKVDEDATTCAATLTVLRVRTAPIDPAFADGDVRFFREYVAELASMP